MIFPYKNSLPTIDETAFIAPTADIIGNVHIGANASVWFGAVIRGDDEVATIGEGTNVQDLVCIHVAHGYPTTIGRHVTIGHSAIVHACTIGDHSLIGMGATILDGAQIGHHVIIGANSLVPQNKVIPDYSMVFGSPAKVIRRLTEEEVIFLEKHAVGYQMLAKDYLSEEPHEEK